MTLTRRQALTGLLGAAALGGAAGCARGDYLAPAGTTSIWYWDRSISDNLLAQAPKATGLKLLPQKIPSDFKSKLLTSLAGHAYVPDVTGINSDIATYFPDADQFVNLYDLGAKDVQSQYLDWKWNYGVTPDNRLIGFPMDTGPTALFYRVDLFEKAGLPTDPAEVAAMMKTWQQYLDVGEQFTKKQPNHFFISNPNDLFGQVTSSLGKLYMTRDGKYIGDQEHIHNAWKIAVDAHKRKLTARVTNGTPDFNASLQTGRVSTYVGAVWWAKILSDTAPTTSGKWRVTDAPGGAGNSGGSFMAITKYCRDPEAAYKIIRFLQSPQNQIQSYNEIQLFPAAKEALTSDAVHKPSKFYGNQVINDVFGRSALQVKPSYLSPYDGYISGAIGSQLTNVWSTGKDPDAAWKDALNDVQRQLRHRGVI